MHIADYMMFAVVVGMAVRFPCHAAYTGLVGQVTMKTSRALASIRAAKRNIIRTLVWIAGVTVVVAVAGALLLTYA
jgi:hypothetical protein